MFRQYLADIILIELSLRDTGDIPQKEPFVCVVTEAGSEPHTRGANKFIKNDGKYYIGGQILSIINQNGILEIGEILIVFPNEKLIQRFYRPKVNGNTILLTEKCDQVCMMCSQPPKNKDYLHWDLYLEAASLIPDGGTLGISGGEPTLYKNQLLQFLIDCIELNKNLQINVLTNAQHFDENDIDKLLILNKNVLWGVPIYSHIASQHDQIVGKEGAFLKLKNGFNCLLMSGSRVELRTVLMQENYAALPKLAKLVSRHFLWVERWAIMQLEPIGYAKIDWPTKFVDTTLYPENLEQAVLIAKASGIYASLYNFPRCTVPPSIRYFCVNSISDWKQKFLSECITCSQKNSCCGFFEWYDKNSGYKSVRRFEE